LMDLLSFGFFQRGRTRSFARIHRASLDQLEAVVFDYEYDLRGDIEDNEDREAQTVLGFRVPDLDLPMVDKRAADKFHYHGKGDLVYLYFEKHLLKPREYEPFVTRCLKTLEKLRRDPPKPIRPPAGAEKSLPRKKPALRRRRKG